jgi:AraC-like DNA-binding protein
MLAAVHSPALSRIFDLGTHRPYDEAERLIAMSYPIETALPARTIAPATRRTLAHSDDVLVEDLQAGGLDGPLSPEGFSPDFQVCLPYGGAFVWHVGRDDVVADANQVLFVTGGETFRISQQVSASYGELILTPSRAVVDELTHENGASPAAHLLFRRRSRSADPPLQRQAALLRHLGRHSWADSMIGDDTTLELLRHALHCADRCETPTRATKRVSNAAKEYLHANLRNPIRVGDVARAVGVSATYLTDLFRRIEGLPIHRYLTQLRLATALVELPHTNDLTTLAYDLGFSSHSHFTAVFRQAFGETPSAFREAARRSPSR